jgi:hypothetical protein
MQEVFAFGMNTSELRERLHQSKHLFALSKKIIKTDVHQILKKYKRFRPEEEEEEEEEEKPLMIKRRK